MRMTIVFCLMAMVISFWCCAWAVAQGGSGPQDVFRKPLAEGTEIIVTRQALDGAPDLVPLLPARMRKAEHKKVYNVTVALRNRDGLSIQLASCVQVETGTPNAGFAVLDAIADEGEVLIVIGAGGRLGLWRVRLDTFSEDAIAWLDMWQVDARAMPVTAETVTVTMSRLPDGRWRASVVDARVEPRQPPTVYEQAADAWKMVLVKKSSDGRS